MMSDNLVIEMISKENCSHCMELKEEFSTRGIQYKEYDYLSLVSNKDTKRLFILKNRKVTTTPAVLIYLDDWLIDCIEYTKRGLSAVLDSIDSARKKAVSI